MLKRIAISTAKILSIVGMLCLVSCGKERAGISEIPQLFYEGMELEKSYLGKDSMVHITVRFTDGDGDIGLGEEDTLPPFDYSSLYWQNMPVKIMHQVNGQYEALINPITSEPFRLPSERVPRLTPDGKNKTISGTITVHIPANPLNTQPQDVKYEIQLIDRNLNISNTLTTPAVQLEH